MIFYASNAAKNFAYTMPNPTEDSNYQELLKAIRNIRLFEANIVPKKKLLQGSHLNQWLKINTFPCSLIQFTQADGAIYFKEIVFGHNYFYLNTPEGGLPSRVPLDFRAPDGNTIASNLLANVINNSISIVYTISPSVLKRIAKQDKRLALMLKTIPLDSECMICYLAQAADEDILCASCKESLAPFS